MTDATYDQIGYPSAPTRVSKTTADIVGRRAQLFPIRSALSMLSWPADKRELWERALARRAVLR
jgi:hypothetical protein